MCNINSSYQSLTHEIYEMKVKPEKVSYLKDMFKPQINSIRSFTRIKTLPDLIGFLESRDILSEYNIEPLRQICQHLRNDELSLAVEQYQEEDLPAELVNVYSIQREREEQQIKNEKFLKKAPVRPKSEETTNNGQKTFEEKRAAIYKVIAEDIGLAWRTFSRAIGIKIGEIDRIEARYPNDLLSRVYAVLNVFENDPRNNPSEHFYILCEGLDASRRKDIRRSIQKILTF